MTDTRRRVAKMRPTGPATAEVIALAQLEEQFDDLDVHGTLHHVPYRHTRWCHCGVRARVPGQDTCTACAAAEALG